jgi:hypothetical protein
MSGWSEWADNLALLRRDYQRAAGYGMVTDDELAFLEHYARWTYTGQGLIVDLGCWLGATTLALARGVSANPAPRRARPIEAIDRFVWEGWMTPIAQALGVPRAYQPGDDFLEDTRALLGPYAPLVTLTQANLLEKPAGRVPVEFLFIDAMKSWDLANAIARGFFPRLTPGRSLVVQQDFGYHHPIGATNHLLMWLLRDFFEPVLHVPASCSMVFFHLRPLTRHDLPALDRRRIAPEQVEAAWDHSLRVLGPDRHGPVRLCQLLFMVEQGWEERAVAKARALAADGFRCDTVARADARLVLAHRRKRLAAGSRGRECLDEIERLL